MQGQMRQHEFTSYHYDTTVRREFGVKLRVNQAAVSHEGSQNESKQPMTKLHRTAAPMLRDIRQNALQVSTAISVDNPAQTKAKFTGLRDEIDSCLQFAQSEGRKNTTAFEVQCSIKPHMSKSETEDPN